MADTTELVKTVIQVLNDGSKGFADLGEHLQEPSVKAFFIKEGPIRAEFARELAIAAGTGGEDLGGTTGGALHRVWGDVKAKLGGGDHTLLETAEQGEDTAKKAYKEAIESSDTPEAVKSVLLRQQPHIQASHDSVKAFRDSTS